MPTSPPLLRLTRLSLRPATPWDVSSSAESLSGFVVLSGSEVPRMLHVRNLVTSLPQLYLIGACTGVSAVLHAIPNADGTVVLEARYSADHHERWTVLARCEYREQLRGLAQQAADALVAAGRQALAGPLLPLLLGEESPREPQTLL